ncbi:MAG: hypothetical protein K0S11_977 [Gammaproteobacteria bacterium]|jgi:hypothetical protein|nr:hypothetical protein [Gammaproteobacteria bacterium]
MHIQQAIYQAALTRDEAELKRLLTSTSIEKPAPGQYGWSAAAQLAFEGHHQAVTWLKNHGADINIIAENYARGGHTAQVKEYHTLHGADIRYITYGYAMGGYTKLVEICCTLHEPNTHYIAQGYARGGHIAQVEKYRQNGAKINIIAGGYAMGNHIESEKGILFILAFSRLAKEGLALTRALCCYSSFGNIRLSPHMATALFKQAQFIQNRMQHYQLTFDEAYAWSLYAKQLMQFVYNDTLQAAVGCQDTFAHIVYILTGVEAAKVPDFFEKIRVMLSTEIESKDIFLPLLEQIEQTLITYPEGVRTGTYSQTAKEMNSLEQLSAQVDALKTSEKTTQEKLYETIGLLKKHTRDLEVSYHYKMGLFKPLPPLAEVYRVILETLPKSLVNGIEVSSLTTDLAEQESAATSMSNLGLMHLAKITLYRQYPG